MSPEEATRRAVAAVGAMPSSGFGLEPDRRMVARDSVDTILTNVADEIARAFREGLECGRIAA